MLGKSIENRTGCYFAAGLNFSVPTPGVCAVLCMLGKEVVELEDNW